MTRVSYLTMAAALAMTAGSAAAQAQKPVPSQLPLKHTPEPTVAAITPRDLMTRLYIFADDSMMGRQIGTQYSDKGTAYIANEVKKLGLKPGGDNGTYFQNVHAFTRAPD